MKTALAEPEVAVESAIATSCDACLRATAVPDATTTETTSIDGMRESQRRWAARPLRERLGILRATRHALAAKSAELAAAISPSLSRTTSDTLVAEVLPLLSAIQFLERNAVRLLKPRKLGSGGRPLWLAGVVSEVHREPLGHVLVIGPSNFPLFLPGSQVMQALAAGNAVTWKPGTGGAAVAQIVAGTLRDSGLPKGILRVTEESVEAGVDALRHGADKVVFTGSSASGHAVLHTLAETATPAIVELSGADAVVVLPSADLARVAQAVAFGLRLNGGAVCMSPRRLFATATTMSALRPLLTQELASMPAVSLSARTAADLHPLLEDAAAAGAHVRGEYNPAHQSPLLVDKAKATMRIARADLFAPVLSLIEVPSMMHVPELHAACHYGLTAAIFGDETEARAMGRSLRVGTILVNDLIVPTADPRVPFGGRGASGYGSTRGAEGLLEMTAVKTVLVRRGRSDRHLKPVTDADAPTFHALIQMLHGRTWSERWAGVKSLATSKKH